MTKSVVHVTSVHRAADVRIYWKECRSLAAAGYQVTLVAPSDDATVLEAVTLRPIPRFPQRWLRMTVGTFQAARAAWRCNGLIYHIHDPELLPLAIALRLRGKRVIYDAHEDLASQILTKPWVPKILRRPMSAAANILLSLSETCLSLVVAATPAIAARYRRAVVIQNFPLSAEFGTADTRYEAKPPLLVYVGGITRLRGIYELIGAVGLVRSSLETRLALVGSFAPPSLEHECRRLPGWDRVDYHGWLSRSELLPVLSRARVGLVVLQPAPNYVNSYPTKLFEYLSAGIPVIASDFPLWRQIVLGGGFGLVVDPADPIAIANAVTYLLEHPNEAEAMGRRGQLAVAERFNWEAEAAKLISAYDRLALPRRTATR